MSRHKSLFRIVLALLFCFSACDQESARKQTTWEADSNSDQVANSKTKSDESLSVLFIGNSHSAPIPLLLKQIFAHRRPELATNFRLAPGSGFLIDQMKQKSTTDAIRSGQWDYVVLQAQKYSTTGKYKYSTEGAIALAEMAKESGAKVLMYPEWSRRDVPDEYKRIRAIHDSIAEETGAVVAPIGEAWELAAKSTKCDLYHADGNHASELGSYLNACVFYSMFVNDCAVLSSDPASDREKVDEQRLIAQAAWSAVQATHRESVSE